MRSDTEAFLRFNNLLYKEPRFYIEIMYDNAYTDPYYLTSHNDVDLPSTATTANTIHNVIESIQGTQQKLNPLKATSSIGKGKAKIEDLSGAISDLLSGKWAAGEALRGKRFRTYVGYKDAANSDYTLIGTQQKYTHTFDGVSYIFNTEDIQRSVKKEIFDLNETTLTQSLTIDQVAAPVTSSSLFETNWHDANYSDSPTANVGYISLNVGDSVEVIKWTSTLNAESGSSASDVSFAASDQSVNSVSSIDFTSFFDSGQLVTVTGSGSNNDSYIVNTVASAKMTLYALDGASAAGVVDESAGATITVTAPIQFYNCTRGALNTAPKAYEVDTTISTDRRQKVEEYVYIETALPKIAYALLTGIWYGTANTTPSNWDLGIDTSLINSASFINYKDLYDTSDESGKIFRFLGEKKQDGKKFIAEQCALPIACFLRVLNDGDLALRRMTPVLYNASYVRHLTQADVVGNTIPTLKYDDHDVHNIYRIKWNYEASKDKTTRTHALTDTASVTKQNGTDTIDFEFRGLHGSRHTLQSIYDSFNMLRDRYAGPPILANVKVLHKHNNLEIGDVIRLTLDNVYDATNTTTSTVDRSFEVQGMTVDWLTGDVTLELFGSTEKAGLLSSTSDTTVLSDDFYSTTSGLLAANKLDAVAGLTTSTIGGVLHITGASAALTGEASVTTSSIYWMDTPVQIDSGVDVTFTNNIHIYVKGDFNVSGSISGAGAGMTSGAGVMGTTKSGGAIRFRHIYQGAATLFPDIAGSINEGVYTSLPYFNVTPDSAGDSLSGLPLDLRGSASPVGASTVYSAAFGGSSYTGTLTGGAAAAGGGGLVVVSRGVSAGASGYYETSGDAGVIGGASQSTAAGLDSWSTLYAGSSGGGAPAGVAIFLDGNSAVNGLSDSNFRQQLGDSPNIGTPISNTQRDPRGTNSSFYNSDAGYQTQNLNNAFWRVQYIPDTTAAVEDAPDLADVAIAFASVVETKNSPPTSAQNLSTFQVDLTPPSDTNYQYSNVYYKLSTLSDSEYLLVGPALDSVAIPNIVMDGSTYDVIAKPVSKKGIESTDFIHTTFTAAIEKGGAVMDTGNYIAVGQTAFNTGLGAWIEKTASGVKASFGDSAGQKVVIDNDAGDIVSISGSLAVTTGDIGGFTIGATSLTAGSGSTSVGMQSTGSPSFYAGSASPGTAPFRVNSNGYFYSTSGTIGFWDIGSSSLTASSGQISLDAGAGRIQVQNVAATNYVRMSGSGIVGVDSVLGTTLNIPTDGSAPTFASGVINSTVYNISTAGILRTSTTVGDGSANSAGVLINDTGVKCFPANSSTANVHLDATDGSVYMGDGADKFLEFDNTDVNIGRDTKIHGADAYNNDAIYESGFLSDAAVNSSSSGTGSFVQSYAGINLVIAANADTAKFHRESSKTLTAFTWAKSRRLKFVVKTPTTYANNSRLYAGTGLIYDTVSDGEALGFKFHSDGNIYSRTANGTTNTESSLVAFAQNTEYALEIVWTTGTNAKFYVDGTLYNTETSTLPSGTLNANDIIVGYVLGLGTDSDSWDFNEYKFNQDE